MENKESKIIRLFKAPPVSTDPSFQEMGQGENKKFADVLLEYANKEIIEKNLSESTKKKYFYFIAAICEFLKHAGIPDITLEEVRIKIMEQMRQHLQTDSKQGICHASRHIELCKRVMNYAVSMEYTLNNPIAPIRARRAKTKEVVNLEKSEIELLKTYNFQSEALRRAADLYLYQCYTGLSYGDLYSHKVTEREGRMWLINQRKKNGNPYYVPLFPQAKAILDKYKGELPMLHNVSCNRYLKEIAAITGIKKYLTTHTGRKTFATIMDQDGVSTKTISDMLGNTLQVCQKHYLAKSSKRIEIELSGLSLMPEKKQELNTGPVCHPCSLSFTRG